MGSTMKVKRISSLLGGRAVEKLDTEPLTAPGENYGSTMLALDLHLGPEQLRLVGKMLPASETLRSIFDVQSSFRKELDVYTKIIPAIGRMYQESGLDPKPYLGLFPKCFGGRISLDPDSPIVDDDALILFENLKVLGFQTDDRFQGFDLETVEMVLRDLATFHASTIVYRRRNKEHFDAVVRPMIHRSNLGKSISEEIGRGMGEEFAQVLRQDAKGAAYADRIADLVSKGARSDYDIIQKEPFATLIHCDFWVNNSMILRDSAGKPISNKIVDFQLVAYGSLAHDLLFLLHTSIENTTLEANYEHFLKVYHDSFIKTVSKFGLDLEEFSYSRLKEEVKSVVGQEAAHIFMMLRPIFTERNKVSNMEDFDFEEMSRSDLLGEDFRRKLLTTTHSFLKLGYLLLLKKKS